MPLCVSLAYLQDSPCIHTQLTYPTLTSSATLKATECQNEQNSHRLLVFTNRHNEANCSSCMDYQHHWNDRIHGRAGFAKLQGMASSSFWTSPAVPGAKYAVWTSWVRQFFWEGQDDYDSGIIWAASSSSKPAAQPKNSRIRNEDI